MPSISFSSHTVVLIQVFDGTSQSKVAYLDIAIRIQEKVARLGDKKNDDKFNIDNEWSWKRKVP